MEIQLDLGSDIVLVFRRVIIMMHNRAYVKDSSENSFWLGLR